MNKYCMWKKRAQLMYKVSCSLLIVIGMLITVLIVQSCLHSKDKDANLEASHTEEPVDESVYEPVEDTPDTEIPVVKVEFYDPVVTSEYIGDFTVTYYCPCEICCGAYGANRPVVNNQEVVLTASGSYAEEGITVAVDPNKIPYGTLLYIEGVGYRIAQDCGGAIQGNRIDVYMDTHAEAYQQGVHESKVYIITGGMEEEPE